MSPVFSLFSASNDYIDEKRIAGVCSYLTRNSMISAHVIERGVKQTAEFWTEKDGTREDFSKFCTRYACKTPEEKKKLFNRLCYYFESILGHQNKMSLDLQAPSQLSGYSPTPIDALFAGYDGFAHFQEDMFKSKIAFVVILNFPRFTLEEKSNNGEHWTDLEWGYVRLGEVFISRLPAALPQKIATTLANAENYISNYNIVMGDVWTDDNEKFWTANDKFIAHWGLRDELKACYADRHKGTKKQRVLYNVMKRIVMQDIPEEVINNNEYIWYPSSNQIFLDKIEITATREKNIRYRHWLEVFKAESAADPYYGKNSTFISRTFDNDYEISVETVERLFTTLLASPQVEEVAKLIKQRLDRDLQPFDIWYDGFKGRGCFSQKFLDSVVRKRYPTVEAFANDLPRVLRDLGFSAEKAAYICQHVTVEPSVGAGHAWGAKTRADNAHLRTRINEDGMDYKGYNIGIHEFGHNVEQTISLHDVSNYFLNGVPNTAFTEALAFIFQSRDLALLNLEDSSLNEAYQNLDIFWNCYEIMGVALVDIKTWQWLYEHPDAADYELRDAVIAIAKNVWNQYYAPIFKVKDQPILAIYSHLIEVPLYVSAYPIGHIISFQLEHFLKNKNIGTEVERIFKIGRKTPDVWMREAVGMPVSIEPLLAEVEQSIATVKKTDKSRGKR
ncbi:MAG: hypothetical protein LBR51_05065 [Bacteroidales bacterium]|jgi:hypothetical protein|nr:hypothetical protein [Bacteroidales bacterium]